MTRSQHALGILLVGVCILASSCVEPPVAQEPLCEESEAQAICIDAPEGFYTDCCNTLNALLDGPPEPAQIEYYSACVDTIVSTSSRLDRCMRAPSEIVTTWNMRSAVTECHRLYTAIESDDTRESDYMLPCVERLVDTSFDASHAQDPIALIAMCETINGSRDLDYSRKCIDILSSYEWFPAGPTEYTTSQNLQRWKGVDNQITELCTFSGTCDVNEERMRKCLSAFTEFTPQGVPIVEIAKMFSSTPQQDLSCTLCEGGGAMNCRVVDYFDCHVGAELTPPTNLCGMEGGG